MEGLALYTCVCARFKDAWRESSFIMALSMTSQHTLCLIWVSKESQTVTATQARGRVGTVCDVPFEPCAAPQEELQEARIRCGHRQRMILLSWFGARNSSKGQVHTVDILWLSIRALHVCANWLFLQCASGSLQGELHKPWGC